MIAPANRRRPSRLSRSVWILPCLAAAGAALLLVRCLPPDTRPTPATIQLTVAPSDAATDGFTTSDGWNVVFERLLVGLGDAGIGDGVDAGPSCVSYTASGYERLFDLTVPGSQKLSEVFGLGLCEVDFSLRTPGSDALLGEKVTAADLAFMREQDSDAVVMDRRTAVFARGHASSAGGTKQFAWSFRSRYRFNRCRAPGDAPPTNAVVLRGGASLQLGVVIRGEELFRAGAQDTDPLRFNDVAEADADGDGTITLEELAKTPAPADELDVDAGVESADGGPASLADLFYAIRVARMVRLGDSEACEFARLPLRP